MQITREEDTWEKNSMDFLKKFFFLPYIFNGTHTQFTNDDLPLDVNDKHLTAHTGKTLFSCHSDL